jgi:aminoglycoside 3-N-acetyltransferase
MAVTKKDIIETIRKAGLTNKTVCVHSSLKSFGEVKGGPDAVVDAFIQSGCTMIVPTFSFSYGICPPAGMKPERNGMDYKTARGPSSGDGKIYGPESNEFDIKEMGAIPGRMLEMKGRQRGSHPLCSFTAAGPYAPEIIRTQQPLDAYAPLREAALFEGYVALIGVGLNRMTILHLAEQMAGRNMFIRWAGGADGKPVMAEAGGCPEGFSNIDPYVNHIDRREKCGESLWRVFPINKLLKQAARVIQLKPGITHCCDPECIRCRDIIAGGPVL